jgi:hypothetical protein
MEIVMNVENFQLRKIQRQHREWLVQRLFDEADMAAQVLAIDNPMSDLIVETVLSVIRHHEQRCGALSDDEFSRAFHYSCRRIEQAALARLKEVLELVVENIVNDLLNLGSGLSGSQTVR